MAYTKTQIKMLMGLSLLAQSNNMSVEDVVVEIRNDPISDIMVKYPELFNGSIASIGKNINPSDPDYEEKIRRSLMGAIRRSYRIRATPRVRQQFPNITNIARAVEHAYKNRASSSGGGGSGGGCPPIQSWTTRSGSEWKARTINYSRPINTIPYEVCIDKLFKNFTRRNIGIIRTRMYTNIFIDCYLEVEYVDRSGTAIQTMMVVLPITFVFNRYDRVRLPEDVYVDLIRELENRINRMQYPIYLVSQTGKIRIVII